MWPGLDSRIQCHKWVEFVVGSRPCSKGFSLGSPVFLPPQKSTFLNSNSIGNLRAMGLSVLWLLCVTLVKTKLIYLFYLFTCTCTSNVQNVQKCLMSFNACLFLFSIRVWMMSFTQINCFQKILLKPAGQKMCQSPWECMRYCLFQSSFGWY